MNQSQNEQPQGSFLADCARIYRDTEGLLALYAEDAVLESPLVPAILDDKSDGILRGESELRRFFVEGGRRHPNDLVRWYRTGEWLTDGRRLLVWEYPRQAPDGDQVDLVEFMEIAGGLIRCHRIYWGWKGCTLIAQCSRAARPRKARGGEGRARRVEGQARRGSSEPVLSSFNRRSRSIMGSTPDAWRNRPTDGVSRRPRHASMMSARSLFSDDSGLRSGDLDPEEGAIRWSISLVWTYR
jgi:hypothetical protein